MDTLEAFRAAGLEDPWLILSSEALAGFPSWRDPRRVLDLARLAVVPRGGHDPLGAAWLEERFPGAGRRARFLSGPLLPISGSVVRRRAAAGRSVRYLVPDDVARYIADHRPVHRTRLEDADHVTEPTPSAPRPDGLPHRDAAAPSTGRAPLDLARRIVELAEDKKAADIVLLDLVDLTTLADAFVICSGGSERQIDAIADGIIEGLRAEGERPIGREGTPASHWVLVDFGSVIVHVFTPPERDYYGLEKHWAAARVVVRVQ